MKLFRNASIDPLFGKPFTSKWLFDVELFHRLKSINPNVSTIAKEIPLDTWIEKGASKITFMDLAKIPFELYRIHRRYS